jgi:hypothetical protein
VWGASDSGWLPLFSDDDDSPLLTIPLAGEWNTAEEDLGTPRGGAWTDGGRITFAARGYALAKCVELGYAPWGTLAPALHRACVRTLRADYCGDGKSWTADGTLLNIYDDSGVQARDAARPYPEIPSTQWRFEAEWDDDGAICVASFRVEHRADAPPTCARGLVSEVKRLPACGSVSQGFGRMGTALLMTEWARPARGPGDSSR